MKLWYWPTRRLFLEVQRDTRSDSLLGLLLTVYFERKVKSFGKLRMIPWVSTQLFRYDIANNILVSGGGEMITVSDQDKCVCIWGSPAYIDHNMISEYKARGYTIVRLSNGTGNIRECIKTVAKSSGII